MQTVGLFCGARLGAQAEYQAAAEALVDELVHRNITLVFGGGGIGIMGVLADRALAQGGRVIGVTPQALVDLEQAHTNLTRLIVVDNMHERKAKISELSDGFIALPGGVGTMDEWFQEITLRQIGYHGKPCGLLNTAGYYDHLMQWLQHGVQEDFIVARAIDRLIVDASPLSIVERLVSFGHQD